MTLRLNGDSSGFTEIKAADAAGDNSIKLPASNGSANQLLQNGGTAGELQYTSAGGGLHYDSGGRLLVNESSIGTDNFSTNSPLQVTAGNGAYALAIRNRSPQNDFGFISFGSDDGNEQLANIYLQRTAENTASLSFATNNGSASTSKRIEIAADGALKLINSPGIDFSGIQGAAATGVVNSETLGNYEAGQWLPTISSGSTPSSTLNVYRSAYTRVGRLVTLQLYVNFAGGDNGVFQIGNLPFAVDSTTAYIPGQGASNGFEGIGSVMMGNFNLASTLTAIAGYAWTNYIRLYYTPPGVNQSWISLTGNEVGGAGNGGNIIMTITYITADA